MRAKEWVVEGTMHRGDVAKRERLKHELCTTGFGRATLGMQGGTSNINEAFIFSYMLWFVAQSKGYCARIWKHMHLQAYLEVEEVNV